MTPTTEPQVTSDSICVVDARAREGLTADEVQAFRAQGVLVIQNLLSPEELTALQDQTMPFITRALETIPTPQPGQSDAEFQASLDNHLRCFSDDPPGAPDTFYRRRTSGEIVPMLVDFNLDKSAACRAVAGHPFLLRTVEALMGKDFTLNYDPIVFKAPGAGAVVPWHRDGYSPDAENSETPVFTIDIYLDASSLESGLYALPGSHLWPHDTAIAEATRRNDAGVSMEGAVGLPARAGDIVLHHSHVLHGSPASQSPLRRVLYLDFRPVATARKKFHDTFVRLMHRRLMACLSERAGAAYARGETPYCYRADVSQATQADPDWQSRPLYRVLQHEYENH